MSTILDQFTSNTVPWMSQAACIGTDPDAFYAIDAGHMPAIREAKATCRRCPVRSECLTFALETDERHGIWGGCDPVERQMLSRRVPVKRAKAIDAEALTLTPAGRHRIDLINDAVECGRSPLDVAELCGVDIVVLERWLHRVGATIPWVQRSTRTQMSVDTASFVLTRHAEWAALGWSDDECATELGCLPQTYVRKVNRARKTLRDNGIRVPA